MSWHKKGKRSIMTLAIFREILELNVMGLLDKISLEPFLFIVRCLSLSPMTWKRMELIKKAA
jgi:hypothetical protein